MHIPLNRFLKKIKKVDNARCPACGDLVETIAHYLLRCPGYAYERWKLAQHLEKKELPQGMKMLLGNPLAAIPLANYIKATGRLKQQGK